MIKHILKQFWRLPLHLTHLYHHHSAVHVWGSSSVLTHSSQLPYWESVCPNFTDYYYKLTGVSRSESAKVGNNNSGPFYAIVLYEFDNRRPTLFFNLCLLHLYSVLAKKRREKYEKRKRWRLVLNINHKLLQRRHVVINLKIMLGTWRWTGRTGRNTSSYGGGI